MPRPLLLLAALLAVAAATDDFRGPRELPAPADGAAPAHVPAGGASECDTSKGRKVHEVKLKDGRHAGVLGLQAAGSRGSARRWRAPVGTDPTQPCAAASASRPRAAASSSSACPAC